MTTNELARKRFEEEAQYLLQEMKYQYSMLEKEYSLKISFEDWMMEQIK